MSESFFARHKKKLVIIGAVLGILTALYLLLWAILGGVAPRYNQQSATASTTPPHTGDDPPAMGMWPDHPEQDDNTLMLVAISGGGSRAAAVGWKALETLRGIPYRFTNAQGQIVESNLAREIDLIAGISGGSFAATAWCLGQDYRKFQERFVERDIERELAINLLSGKGWIAHFSRRYARINFAAELYDEEVFDRKTFADLPSRPILRLHATNLALSQRFTFTRETFARIGSDLNSYPVGYACAASSAFPILLTPLTLRNYPPALDYSQDRNYITKKDNSRENLREDLTVKAWDYYNDKKNEYLHLADGGLVDNQGLQSILDEAVENTGLILKRINNTKAPLRRLIIVNLNAGVASPDASGQSPAPPGVLSVVQSTMVASMDVLSARRWMEIKETCDAFNKVKIDAAPDSPYRLLETPYAIEVSFRNILDPEKKQKAMELPTSFELTPDQLKLIGEVVPKLLEEDPDLQRLKTELAK
jgi:NTE family protein